MAGANSSNNRVYLTALTDRQAAKVESRAGLMSITVKDRIRGRRVIIAVIDLVNAIMAVMARSGRRLLSIIY